MKYDFTSIIDRVGRDASAIDSVGTKGWGAEPEAPKEGFDFIPMWVADMNFATSPSVTKAIIERAQHPLFGYYMTRKEYYESIIRWQTTRHNVTGLTAEAIGYENGVHGGVTSAIQIMTEPGDSVLVHTPLYIGFRADVDMQGRKSVFSPLTKDENGIYRMDFDDMDRKIRENHIHAAIFCSPHNPTGRVWEKWELEKAMQVYQDNQCYVISDEIWSDIVYAGHEHIPTQMVSEWAREHTAAYYAPSKTFNLAGLVGSYHIIYNQYLRDRIVAHSARTHYNSQNVLSMHALIGAYNETGAEWVEELLQVLRDNTSYAADFITENFPGVAVTKPQGTYMLFLDLTAYCEKHHKTLDEMIKTGWSYGVGWQDGRGFGGPCHIRMNVALPRVRVEEAMRRLKAYVFTD
ncbi:MAG: aminotransferase class I/II-fold pyridoxal phosphate-dependent enzyme [Clostridia bacterium]|nr:aminotransferase class I/II-fold pyridoxal phosphate-dependent enzyme [Clostridia bacterium]